jgi:hypothetical protein
VGVKVGVEVFVGVEVGVDVLIGAKVGVDVDVEVGVDEGVVFGSGLEAAVTHFSSNIATQARAPPPAPISILHRSPHDLSLLLLFLFLKPNHQLPPVTC